MSGAPPSEPAPDGAATPGRPSAERPDGPSPADRVRRAARQHRFGYALRLAAFAATVAAAAALAALGFGAWAALAGLAAAAQVAPLLRAAERPARDLLRFLEAVRNDDLSVGAGGGVGPLPEAIRAAFAEVAEAFRRVRAEREEQALYLQTIVRHVGVALVAVRDGEAEGGGTVALFNEAAARLLGVRHPRSVAALDARHPALVEALRRGAGGRTLVEVERDEQPLTLVVHTTRLRLGGAPYTLASLQDIRPELEAKEIDAWQQLTRVLTHEIMNSVAPITSLAATATDLLAEGGAAGAAEALRVIERRSAGLLHFVEAYRTLARVPAPVFRIVPAREVLGGVHTLLRTTAAERGADLRCHVEPADLDLVADPDLLEQALLNVVLNALQAVEGRPGARVDLVGRTGPSGRPVVEVVDNGPGVSPEAAERIFVPFYTTKPEGSGIGLSLARQVVRLHGGTLTVRRGPAGGAAFVFRF